MQPAKRTYKKATINYLEHKLHLDRYQVEELPEAFHAVVNANLNFIRKLEAFKHMVDCLSADRCFKLWINETEMVLAESENCLQYFAYNSMTEEQFRHEQYCLAKNIFELAERVYEGHWEYGISRETDKQFNDLTELCRRIWDKESKAWITLAKAWDKIDFHLIVYNDEQA